MKASKRNSERGVALLMVLMIVILLSAIGAALIFMSNIESSVNLNYRAEQQAYYAARAGVEEVRDRIKLGPPFQAAADPVYANLPAVTPGGGANGVLYVINQGTDPTPVQPWTAGSTYMDDEICHDYNFAGLQGNLPVGQRCQNLPPAGWYTSTASTSPFSGTSGALNYKWVRVTLKENNSVPGHPVDNTQPAAATQICYDGTNELLLAGAATCQLMNPASPPEPVYMLTALAVTNNGARRMVQSEAAKVLFPPTPAALTFAGVPANFQNVPNSNGYAVTGNQPNGNPNSNPPTNCTPGDKPGIGAFDAAQATAVTGQIVAQTSPPNRLGNYTGSPAPISNIGPSGANTLGPWGNVNTLNQIVTNISAQANQTVSVPIGQPLTLRTAQLPLGNMGSAANPVITVMGPGPVTFSGNTSGGGILLVTGDLTFSGTTTFDGIILVIGTGSLTFSGGGGGSINGSILVANTLTPALSPPNPPGTPGMSTVNWSGGGGNGITFNSCDTDSLNNKAFYHTIAWREVAY